jgi:hypothetical protein
MPVSKYPLLVRRAEGVGFEPTVLSYNGFQDRRLKPLGHPSSLGALMDAQTHHPWAGPNGFATAGHNPKVLMDLWVSIYHDFQIFKPEALGILQAVYTARMIHSASKPLAMAVKFSPKN